MENTLTEPIQAPSLVPSKVDRTTATYWSDQISRGVKWRKRDSREDQFKKIEKYYSHQFARPLDPHFNLIYMMASASVPTLVFQNPSIINSARRPQFNYWASFFDGIDNWLVDEMEVQEIYQEAVLIAFLFNTFGIEVGYDFPPQDAKIPEEVTFASVRNNVDRSRKTNQPWLDLLPPERLVLAPGTRTIRNCSWYAKNVFVKTESLKEIKGLLKKNIYPTHTPSEVGDQLDQDVIESIASEGYTNLWIIHDAETQKWAWLNSKGSFVYPMTPDPLQVDGLPLTVVSFNRSPRTIWGTPDSLYIETQQVEGDECRYDGRLQRKAALVKCFYDNNLLDEDQIHTFLSSSALGCIPVSVPTDKKLGDVIQLVQPHVQGEYPIYQKELLNDAQLVVGVGPNQAGMYASGRRTAKEASVVEENSFLRTGMRRSQVAKSIEKVFGTINQLIVREWRAPIVAKVLGVEGAMYWVKALPSEFSDIKAQLVTSVNVESLTPVSREKRRQEMVEVMSIIVKIQGVNIIPILKQFLSNFDWLDVSQALPEANNQQQPMGMQEFQAQQQGMASNPQLGQMASNNIGNLSGVIQRLPR